MSQPSTPRDVVNRLLDGVVRLIRGDTGQVDTLADLYAAHTRVDHPMAPLGIPLLRTREDVRRHFAAAGGTGFRPDDYRVEDLVVHDTADPEVVVAEFAYAGSAGGRTFRVPCVFVVRVRDGRIVDSRDYVDHLAMARATGRLPDLLRRLAAA